MCCLVLVYFIVCMHIWLRQVLTQWGSYPSYEKNVQNLIFPTGDQMANQSFSIMSANRKNLVASILKLEITTYYCLRTLQIDRRIIVSIPTTYLWLTSTLYSLAISDFIVGVVCYSEVCFYRKEAELNVFCSKEPSLLVYVVDSWSSSNDPIETLLILMVVGLINISGILSPVLKFWIWGFLEGLCY